MKSFSLLVRFQTHLEVSCGGLEDNLCIFWQPAFDMIVFLVHIQTWDSRGLYPFPMHLSYIMVMGHLLFVSGILFYCNNSNTSVERVCVQLMLCCAMVLLILHVGLCKTKSISNDRPEFN